MVFEGMVPVLMQTPPTTERASTTATRFFILEAATAARCPEGPEPITVRSYLTALIPRFFPPEHFDASGRGSSRRIAKPGAARPFNRRLPQGAPRPGWAELGSGD